MGLDVPRKNINTVEVESDTSTLLTDCFKASLFSWKCICLQAVNELHPGVTGLPVYHLTRRKGLYRQYIPVWLSQ